MEEKETQLHIHQIARPPTTLIEPAPAPTSEPMMEPRGPGQAPEAPPPNVEDETVCNSESESEPDDHEQCDCLTETALADIPYSSIYESEKEVKERGYFTRSPQASIVEAQRDTRSMMHLVDRYIYTIEVVHGKYRWIVLRRYSDFRSLNNKLLLFRAGQNIAEPMHRLAERRTERRERRLKAQTLHYGHGAMRTDETTTVPLARDDEEDENGVEKTTSSQKQRPNTIHVEKTIQVPRQSPAAAADGHEHGKHQHKHPRRQKPCKLPHFPLLPDTAVSAERLETRKDELGRFLSAVLHVPAYRNHNETLEFLGVSRLSFVNDLGLKSEEGYVKKRPGGARHLNGCVAFMIQHVAPWRRRWLVLKDSYLVYLRPKKEEISEVLLFEFGFKVDNDKVTRAGPKSLCISNLHRHLRIKCAHEHEAEEWTRALAEHVKSIGSIWLQTQRFGSSYPERTDASSRARWFVDGRAFMEEAANMLEAARQDIFITDWWLSPEIFLKRPPSTDQSATTWRLDDLLKRKAEQGVRVFILLYKEVAFALSINSLYSKVKLQSLHDNIKVMRHRGAMNWAHHEKMIIVDQSIAFIGGIDLCYGRWDDHRHRLADMAGAVSEQAISLQQDDVQLANMLLAGLTRYGQQKQEERQKEEAHMAQDRKPRIKHMADIVKRQQQQPLNVQDETPTAAAAEPGPGGGGKERRMSRAIASISEWRAKAKAKKEAKKLEEKLEESDEESDDGFVLPKEPKVELTGNEKWWLGKDYVNFVYKDFIALDAPYTDFIDRTQMPRMPWHDIASVVYGSPARDAARHFIERWNACKVQKCHDNSKYPFLMPKSYENLEIPKRLKKKSIGCSVQIIRSASMISTGRRDTEDSIYQAYMQTIEKAQHYVYIENQFFVSQVGRGKTVLNGIAQAIFDRIVRAHKNNEQFRVYVVMPLLPGFQIGTALFTVLHWTYLSICKGDNSLLKNLESVVGDPSRYISFCALRKYDSMGERLVTELIYIHSKLLIADDRYVIIGSANINDRSQLGDRDSEVAIYAEDTEFDDVPNPKDDDNKVRQPYPCGKFAGSLRRQLFREHLGLLDECPGAGRPDDHADTRTTAPSLATGDPGSQEFFDAWKEIAKKNTELFEEIFDCLPNDNIRSQHQLAEYTPGKAECVADRRMAKERIKGIRGFLVQLPLEFLIDSDLTPPLTTKEGWVPSSIFI